ncbi:MAG: DNA replication protein DnaC, partial [Clostridiales bacterium]|nr:DNA replication protein DnaC [Clostridiales bacterium]
DLLIIDDLGSEISTIITNSEFFNILNTRLLDNRSIVISTNLKLEELEKQYSERIISRFIGRFIMLKFIGDDIRTNLKYNKSLS